MHYQQPKYQIFSRHQKACLIQNYPELYSRHLSSLEYHQFYWNLFSNNSKYPGPDYASEHIWGHLTSYDLTEEGVKQMLANTTTLLKALPVLTLESNYCAATGKFSSIWSFLLLGFYQTYFDSLITHYLFQWSNIFKTVTKTARSKSLKRTLTFCKIIIIRMHLYTIDLYVYSYISA